MNVRFLSSRRKRGVTMAALAALALAGHLYWWYYPRSRPGVPQASSLTGQVILGETPLSVQIWVPYPHQNLPLLERRVGRLDELAGAVRQLVAASPEPVEVPSFGPFRMPPARELALATDSGGKRVLIAAEVYPMISWLGRLAGRLAHNPWLAGGSLTASGRPWTVEWRGRTWIAVAGTAELPERVADRQVAPAVGLLHLTRPQGNLPKGLYRLEMAGREIAVTMGMNDDGHPTQPAPPTPLPEPLALMALAVRSPPEPAVVSGLAVMADTGHALEQLSQMVVYHRGPGDRWRLPGERLAAALGLKVEKLRSGAWVLTAYDRHAVELGEQQLVWLEGSVSPEALSTLRFAVWVDLQRAQGLFLEVANVLDALPFPDRRETRLFAAAGTALHSVADFSYLSLQIYEDPAAVELRLQDADSD